MLGAWPVMISSHHRAAAAAVVVIALIVAQAAYNCSNINRAMICKELVAAPEVVILINQAHPA